MRLSRSLAAVTLVFGFVFPTDLPADESGPPTHPNIVLIFMDDLGYGDIGSFDDNDYPTPHLDAMAAQGRRFTDFVASSAVCSASRAALMTGCYHRRIGISGALGPTSDIGLAAAETTIAEVCRSAGYRTACFGKWHLGHHRPFLPAEHGFDQFYGIPYSNDMWPLHPDTIRRRQKDPKDPGHWPPLPILASIDGGPVVIVNADVQPADQMAMTTELTHRSVDFIRAQSDRPFFLYLPHPMVHVPLYVSEKFVGKSGAGLYGDVMMEIDWSVGQILDAIESIGATNNTLVIFTSDNGPWLSYGDHAGDTAGLREGKGTMWEGGVREPTLMWWPGTIPAGTTCDRLASTIDILPTIVELTGGTAPQLPLDGHSILSLMTDQEDVPSPREFFAGYYAGGQLQTIRNERFKLVFPHRYRTLGTGVGGSGGQPAEYQMVSAELQLFDLDTDVSETTNVIENFPEVADQLRAAAQTVRDDLGDTLTKTPGTGTRPPGKVTSPTQRLMW